MRKNLLTIIVILASFNSAFAASANGRVKMTVVRTNVVPADINVEKTKSITQTRISSNHVVEIIY